MPTKTAPPKPPASPRHKPIEVSSSEFAGRFGHWAFEAQSAPIRVVNNKTGAVMGCFVSAREFDDLMQARDLVPRAGPAWEISPGLAAELDKPLPNLRPELDHLMED